MAETFTPKSVERFVPIPLELREANAFIRAHHRHHREVQGHRFSIGAMSGERLCGVAIVGRPTSGLDPKRIVEVTRLCTDGTFNACSFLYSRIARVAKELGYWRAQTYIFATESGASLLAAGWTKERVAHASGRHHARSDGEYRETLFVETEKTLWVKDLVQHNGEWKHHRKLLL